MNQIEGKCKCGLCHWDKAWTGTWREEGTDTDMTYPAAGKFCPECGYILGTDGIARRTVVVDELQEMWLAADPESGFSVWGAEPFTADELPNEHYAFEYGYWYDPTDTELPAPASGQKVKGYFILQEALDAHIDKTNYTLDIPFARQLVTELGGDPALIQDYWCWRDFGRAYPELAPAAMAWFANAGDARAAYALVVYCGGDAGVAMDVAKQAGDARAACDLAKYCGGDVEAAMEVVKQAGNAWVAYDLAENCDGDVEVAMKVAVKAGDAWAAYRIAQYCGGDVGQAMGVAEKAGYARVIYYLQALKERREARECSTC